MVEARVIARSHDAERMGRQPGGAGTCHMQRRRQQRRTTRKSGCILRGRVGGGAGGSDARVAGRLCGRSALARSAAPRRRGGARGRARRPGEPTASEASTRAPHTILEQCGQQDVAAQCLAARSDPSTFLIVPLSPGFRILQHLVHTHVIRLRSFPQFHVRLTPFRGVLAPARARIKNCPHKCDRNISHLPAQSQVHAMLSLASSCLREMILFLHRHTRPWLWL